MNSAVRERRPTDPIAPEHDKEIGDLFRRVFSAHDHVPERPRLVASDGEAIDIPPEIFDVLKLVVEEMRQGHAVSIVPHSQRISTQEAAELLGISRPTFVKLLEDGALPFEKPGRHRRVLLRDVVAYRAEQHQASRGELAELTAVASAQGLYDASASDYTDALKRARKRRTSD